MKGAKMRIERDKNDPDFFHIYYPWKTIAKAQKFILVGTIHTDAMENIFGKAVWEDLDKTNKGQGIDVEDYDNREK